jgi:outer membrane receptor protein involved in Fe transport
VRIALPGLALCALGATAQEPNPGPASVDDLPKVVVTGSRIAEPNELAISPVTSVTAEAIERSGVTRIEDLLNSLPQVYAGQGANVSNEADGTAEINLRGMGSTRTLVLVNGRRLGPGDSSGANNSDLNQIPAPLIERVEILTGGASSVYGADAVVGVVNFKLLDHFEGVKLVANYGFFDHTNTNAQGVVDAVLDWNATTGANYPLAPGHTHGGANKELSLMAGFNFSDGSGNATFYATYRTAAAVLQSDYSYSACALGSGYLAGENSTGGKFECAGSYTSYPGAFLPLDPVTGQPLTDLQTIGAGNTLIPYTNANLYNYGPYNYFQREDARYAGGAFLHYELSEHAIAYTEAQYMDDRTTAQIAPSGVFADTGPYAVNCNNPELSSSMVNDWCAGSSTGDAVLFIGRRNIEGGPRVDDLEHRSWRLVLGMHGKINDTWLYDVSAQYAHVATQHDGFNDLSITRINNSLRVVSYDPTTGTIGTGAPTCTAALPSSLRNLYPEAGTDPHCVPWNIFQVGGPNAAPTDYLAAQLSALGTVTQRIADANFTGDLGAYGLRVPTARASVKVNVGAEWRQEASDFNPNQEYQSGDAAGVGGPTPPVAGEITVAELYAEAHVPLVAQRSWAETLDFETGYRFSDYHHDYTTNTYKFGLEWIPERSVRLRGSWARAVRAPNVGERFSPQTPGGGGSTDPCWGSTPLYSLAQCERTGVTPAQYGNIAENPADYFNGITGGNPQLLPEAATTVSFGVGWNPPFLPGLHAQADYYDIRIDGVILPIGSDSIVQQCALSGLFCNLIKRDAYGSLWLSPNGYVINTLTNVGALIQRGVDVELGYVLGAGSHGTVRADLIGTYMIDYLGYPIQQLASTSYNCAGYYGKFCFWPAFKWRHTARVTWGSPWRGFEVSLAWRYFSPVTLDALSPNPNMAAPPGQTVANGGISNTDARISSRSYFDLSTQVQLGNRVSLRLGINNLLDKAPPIVGQDVGNAINANGNTFPQVYDSLGRYIFGTLIVQF